MNARTAFTLLVLPLFIAPVSALAQAPPANAAAKAAASATPAPPPAPVGPTPPADYAYDADGRRDPFVSLVNRGNETRTGNAPGAGRPDGVAGIMVDEVVVRGIVQSRAGWVAMIAAPSGRTFTIRPGDRLMDGNVRGIDAKAVVLMQEVNDPLSLAKQREVRKPLRGEVK